MLPLYLKGWRELELRNTEERRRREAHEPGPHFKTHFLRLTMSEEKCDTPVIQELWVENRLGLHARPAMKINNLAHQYKAEVLLEKDDIQVDARDLLAILTLDCPQGTRLVLKATGPEASEAVLSLCRLFARKFDEP